MKIRFVKEVATDHGVIRAGRLVTVRKLPKGWDQWLRAGLIQIQPSDETETAEAPRLPEVAATVRRGGQARPSSVSPLGRASRRKTSTPAEDAPES